MYSTHFSRLLAVPVVTAGIIGVTTLGHIATARADSDEGHAALVDEYDDMPNNDMPSNDEIVPAPDPYSDPASALIPWDQWISDGMATASQDEMAALHSN